TYSVHGDGVWTEPPRVARPAAPKARRLLDVKPHDSNPSLQIGAGLWRIFPLHVERDRHTLINRPQARRRQLEQMPVGIAEIDAVPAARPVGAAFDGDALLAQSPLPLRQLIHGNGKGHVHRSMAVLPRHV